MSVGIMIGFVLLALQVAAIIAAITAVRTARTPQGAVGWVVFLLSAPHFGLPFYLLLGHRRFPGYITARRGSQLVSEGVRRLAQEHGARTQPGVVLGESLTAFEAIAELPVVSGNEAELLCDGDATFDAIIDAIEAAESYVLAQFYIVHDDELGRRFQAALIAKARQGQTVRLLYDLLGSHDLPERYLRELRDAGVVVRNFHSIRQPHSRLQLNFRNHRKIVVVDGETGFVGGLNVGDEYMGRSPRFGHWRDTHLRLAGPVVAQLQLIFIEDWHWATEERLSLNWSPARRDANCNALILGTGPADTMETGSLYFCNAIHAAQNRLWIASPYLVPDVDIVRALQLAALRGVDVRLMIPDLRDHWLVWLAGFAYCRDLQMTGVTILRYMDGFMHQKVLVVDDEVASIGTVNLDNRSCRLNFEVTAIVSDPDFVAATARMLEEDFERCQLHTARLPEYPRLVRGFGASFARLFSPLL